MRCRHFLFFTEVDKHVSERQRKFHYPSLLFIFSQFSLGIPSDVMKSLMSQPSASLKIKVGGVGSVVQFSLTHFSFS